MLTVSALGCAQCLKITELNITHHGFNLSIYLDKKNLSSLIDGKHASCCPFNKIPHAWTFFQENIVGPPVTGEGVGVIAYITNLFKTKVIFAFYQPVCSG